MGRKRKDSVTVICYGKKEIWESREEAIKYYFQGMCECEGSECERYTNVWAALRAGKAICTDED